MKTIPLSTAYAKAVKAPYSIHVGCATKTIFINGSTVDTPNCLEVATMTRYTKDTDKINAALLCHSFNVLPEVVEALMASIECIEASLDEVPSEAREAMQKDVKRYRNILNKASSVPMPE